tara:strand:+ start:30988 stop:32214 length:1227 start_codon:yes stop_codon:yes gene_type:complete
MAFEDEIRQGSFRGAPFHTKSRKLSSGRRGPTIERPNRDQAESQDLGRKVRSFSVPAFVLTYDGFQAKNRLLAALDAPGPGTFVDPFGGQFAERRVKVVNYGLDESFDAECVASFTINFEEVGENTERGVTPGRVSAAFQLTQKSSALSTAAQKAFVNSYVTDGMPGFVRQAGGDVIASLTDQVGGEVFTALGTSSIMSDAIADIGAVGITALTGGGVDIASGLSAGFSILSQAVPSTDDAVSGFLSMASFEAPGIDAPISTLTRQIEAVNRTALGAFVRRTSISMATELLPKHTFISYDQAAKVSESFIDLIGQEMDKAGGDVAGEADSGVFAALSAVRSAVIDFTRESGAGKAKVIEDLPWQTEPSQITAYRLYGDASRADEIVARNGLAHPNLVPSWGPVEVLDE